MTDIVWHLKVRCNYEALKAKLGQQLYHDVGIMRFLSDFNVIGRRIAIIYRLHSTRDTNNTIVRTTIPARWFNHSYAASAFQDIPILDSHIVFAT